MAYLLKNISVNRPLIFTLKDDTTLRLAPGEEKQVSEDQITGYIRSLGSNERLRVLSVTKGAESKGKEV